MKNTKFNDVPANGPQNVAMPSSDLLELFQAYTIYCDGRATQHIGGVGGVKKGL